MQDMNPKIVVYNIKIYVIEEVLRSNDVIVQKVNLYGLSLYYDH